MSDANSPHEFQTVTSTALLEGLRSPDRDSVWIQFDGRYRPLITRYAQQALLAFFTAYGDGKYDREKGRLRQWLFGIARNQILSVRRKLRGQERQIIDASGETRIADRIPDEDEQEAIWEREWQEALLRQCLEEVRKEFDPKTLEVFELFAWKGKPAQEVAEQFDMTANAVFLVKHRVLKRIKTLLPDMEEIW